MFSELETENFGTQKSNLNSDQIEEARCFLSQIYGNFCGAGAEQGKGCGKTVEELEMLWKSEYLRKNQKSPLRKHPFLFINEKQGNGLHRIINNKMEYCGNVCYYCKSCNMIFDRRTGDIKPDERATFQARKSHEVRPKFKNALRDHLSKFGNICYKACINKWSCSDEFKCSQDTLEEAFRQEFDRTLDLINIAEYGIECNYKMCTGEHIILKGFKPTVKESDYNKFLEESNAQS